MLQLQRSHFKQIYNESARGVGRRAGRRAVSQGGREREREREKGGWQEEGRGGREEEGRNECTKMECNIYEGSGSERKKVAREGHRRRREWREKNGKMQRREVGDKGI